MTTDKRYLIYLASNQKGLDLERYELQRLMASFSMVNIGLPFRDDGIAYDWNLVRAQIDSADLFVLLLGGDYGAMMPTGISFLHREFVHAKSTNKPILALLKGIPSNRVLNEEERRLEGFQRIVKQQVPFKVWHRSEELLIHARTELPTFVPMLSGWIKAPVVVKAPKVLPESDLKLKVDSQKSVLEKQFAGVESLNTSQMRMHDMVSLQVSANVFQGGNLALEEVLLPARLDQLLLVIEDNLKKGASTDRLRAQIEQLIAPTVKNQLLLRNRMAHAVDDIRLNKAQFQHLLMRWQEIGLVRSNGNGSRINWFLA